MKAIQGQLAYFSHSLKHYNTESEEIAYNYLRQLFEGFVLCLRQHLCKLSNPKDYARIARATDCVFGIPIEHGTNIISTGCFSEVSAALKNGKKVFLVDKIGEHFILEKVIDVMKANNG